MLFEGQITQIAPIAFWLLYAAGLTVFVLGAALRGNAHGADAIAERRRTAPETEKILYAVARHANDGLIYQDIHARILWANDAYCRTMGYELEEILGRRPQEFCFPPELRPSDEYIENFKFDLEDDEFSQLTRRENIRKNGERFWHEFSLSLIETDDGEMRVVLASRDVTDQVLREAELEKARAKLHHAAHHDALTGLSNRTAFLSTANDVLSANRALGLMYIDLDKFKAVNDTHGHPAGDAVLLHVATAIRNSLPRDGFAGRIGGDEFLVGCPDLKDLTALEYIADNLRERIVASFDWRGVSLAPSASIGLASTGAEAMTPEDLIRMADFALYESKAPGAPTIMRYDAELHARKEEEREAVDEFTEVLNNDALDFVFQPIISAANSDLVGFETLVRWQRKSGDIIGPNAFLKHGATLRRLDEVDFAAARAAAALTARLRAAGYQASGAFNSSPETLARPDFLPRLKSVIDAQDLTPDCINVEVLETTFFGPDARGNPAAERITELREFGTRVYLDDFGIGYAGLAHLGQLDIAGIKIDRSLTANVMEHRAERLIATSILQLCRELSIEVCAEGIEREDQALFFANHGANRLQGYAIARPMPADALLVWATAHVPTPIENTQRHHHMN